MAAERAGSSTIAVLMVPTAMVAAWYISYSNSLIWAPLACALLVASAAVSRWQGGTQPTSSCTAAAGSSKVGSWQQCNAEETLQLIKSRRSVYPKDFNGDNSSITNEKLRLMLEAACWAPTHKLTEPWHFVVIGGETKALFEDMTIRLCRDLLPADKAEQTVAKLQRKKDKDWPKVHCYIALCMQRHDSVPEWEEICAVAAAVQNMSLQATALGVCGYWTSWQAVARDSQEMQQLLGLDASRGDRCLGFYVCGCADADRVSSYRPKRQPLEEKVTWMT